VNSSKGTGVRAGEGEIPRISSAERLGVGCKPGISSADLPGVGDVGASKSEYLGAFLAGKRDCRLENQTPAARMASSIRPEFE